jgi:hypothetical protein
MSHRPLNLLVAAGLVAAALSISGGAQAAGTLPPGTVTLIDTPGPGGVFGTNGYDLIKDQRVAAAFTVPAGADMRFVRAGVWLMNNSGDVRARVGVSLQTDASDEGGSESKPSGVEVEGWAARVQTYGWSPVEQFFDSRKGPALAAGHRYWIVLASNAPGGADAVWTLAARGLGVQSITNYGHWLAASPGGALTLRVDAVPVSR